MGANMKCLLFLLFGICCQIQQSYSAASDNFPKECGTMPVVHSDYKPVGTEVQLKEYENLKVYETGRKNSSRIIIVVYDIFGFHPNTKQVADKVAELGGFRLVMPDFYRSVPWDENNFPPPNWQDLKDWVAEKGNWTKSMKTDIVKVIEHYKNETESKIPLTFGMFGFCWGGGMSIHAGTELTDDVKAIGLVHPSFVEVPEAAKVLKTPVIVLPSQNEPDYMEFFKTVKSRLGDKNIENVRFDDMMHGFASARGDLKNEIVKERVEQVIQLLIKFFNRHLILNQPGTPEASKSGSSRLNSINLLFSHSITFFVFLSTFVLKLAV